MASSSTQSTVFWRTAFIQVSDSSSVESILKCKLPPVLPFSFKVRPVNKVVAVSTAEETLAVLYPKIIVLPMPKTS
jgi:hypothetical protein